MGLVPIDRTRWPRRAHYEWVQKTGQGPFAVTVPLDVTPLAGEPLYPALLWLLTQGVNEMERSALWQRRRVWEFTIIWTRPTRCFTPKRRPFRCSGRLSSGLPGLPGSLSARCGGLWGFPGMDAPGRPSGEYLRCLHGALDVLFGVPLGGHPRAPVSAPHFTLGKWVSQGEARVLPLTVQIHPGVCDPFHVYQLQMRLQKGIAGFPRR